jgi:prepilin-type N-terminal cleavage/methylation domain-containing protein
MRLSAKGLAPGADEGFSLVEMLVAVALTLIITGAAFAIVNPAYATSQTQPEAMDMQQRIRAGTEAMVGDLAMAGAGSYAGPNAGPLVNFFAPVIPRKVGLQNADPGGVARSDAITITYVPSTYSQTTISGSLPQPAGLTVNTQANCPVTAALCGFQAGMTAAVFDMTGHFDLFTITNVVGTAAQVQGHSASAGYVYTAGAQVAEAQTHTYYLDSAKNQLRHYDGYLTDVPVVDNVVGLSFEYFGDPAPPLLPKPPVGTDTCLYDVAGNPKPMAILTAPLGSLAPLPLSMLGDGPWCGAGGTQFDADLLRIRMIRITIRIQATPAAFRSADLRFARAGTSRDARRHLPDLVMTEMVSPRNLNLGR